MYKTKKLIGKIATGVLSAMMVFSVGTMAKANCDYSTDSNRFYLDVNAYEGVTWDVTTCYEKDTTSYMAVGTDGGYGSPIEVSAIGRDDGGLFYDGFADCSGGRTYYISQYTDDVLIYNLIVESGYSFGGLYGRDPTDSASEITGHFHTDI